MDRLKCLVHRITLQQLLGQDILQPAHVGHLHALLEQPPGCTMSAESLADRILERTAHRPLPPEQPAASTLQQAQPPPTPPDQVSASAESTDLGVAAAACGASPGLKSEDTPRSEADSRAAEAHGRGRGSWPDGDDSGAASVSGSDSAAHAAADGRPATFREAASAPPSLHQTGGDARSAAGDTSHIDKEQQHSPPQIPAAAVNVRAADVGHLTPTAMHAGLRVAEARSKAAKLGARLDSVLAVRGGDSTAP